MDNSFSKDFGGKRKVLVVDDEYINRQLLGMILSEEYEVLYAENGREALNMIRSNHDALSVVMLDLIMPQMDGFELLELIRGDEDLRRIPIIVLTSEKEAEVRSLKLGASDFIKKPYDMPEVILARVQRTIELNEGRNLIQVAEKDELTGLYSGSFFYEYAQKLERFHPEWEMDTVAINIDRFHLVNELYGREFGDQVLRILARKIQQTLTGTDGIACRVEADMFLVYCVHREDYDVVLEKILKGLTGVARTVRIRLRVGVYPHADRKLDIERQFDRAKIACNMLRGSFTKSIMIYDLALQRSEIYSESLINDIHKAIEQHQLEVFYQPKYNVRGDKPVLASAEALVRWRHPEYGMVPPGDFIPLFEGNGLIQLVDYYVWREVGRQIAYWKQTYGVTFPVSINVSRIDIYDPDLEKKLLDIVEGNDLSTADLMLEVTESAYAEDSDQLVEAVERLRSHGFRIEMDDFGSGYSSLNMLFSLPIDVLKLDMKFIQNIRENSKSMTLIQLIMDVAKSLEVPVVAEGVETEAQYLLLKDAGCQLIQGYYFAKPETPEEFDNYFKGRN